MPSKKWYEKHNAQLDAQRERYTRVYMQEPDRHAYHPGDLHFLATREAYDLLVDAGIGAISAVLNDRYTASILNVKEIASYRSDTGLEGWNHIHSNTQDILHNAGEKGGIMDLGYGVKIQSEGGLVLGAAEITDTQFGSDFYLLKWKNQNNEDEEFPIYQITNNQINELSNTGFLQQIIDENQQWSTQEENHFKNINKTLQKLKPVNSMSFQFKDVHPVIYRSGPAGYEERDQNPAGFIQETVNYKTVPSILPNNTGPATLQAAFAYKMGPNITVPRESRPSYLVKEENIDTNSLPISNLNNITSYTRSELVLESDYHKEQIERQTDKDYYLADFPYYPPQLAEKGANANETIMRAVAREGERLAYPKIDITQVRDFKLLVSTPYANNLFDPNNAPDINGCDPKRYDHLLFGGKLSNLEEQLDSDAVKLIDLLTLSFNEARRSNLEMTRKLQNFVRHGPSERLLGGEEGLEEMQDQTGVETDSQVDSYDAQNEAASEDLQGQDGLKGTEENPMGEAEGNIDIEIQTFIDTLSAVPSYVFDSKITDDTDEATGYYLILEPFGQTKAFEDRFEEGLTSYDFSLNEDGSIKGFIHFFPVSYTNSMNSASKECSSFEAYDHANPIICVDKLIPQPKDNDCPPCPPVWSPVLGSCINDSCDGKFWDDDGNRIPCGNKLNPLQAKYDLPPVLTVSNACNQASLSELEHHFVPNAKEQQKIYKEMKSLAEFPEIEFPDFFKVHNNYNMGNIFPMPAGHPIYDSYTPTDPESGDPV